MVTWMGLIPSDEGLQSKTEDSLRKQLCLWMQHRRLLDGPSPHLLTACPADFQLASAALHVSLAINRPLSLFNSFLILFLWQNLD